MARTCLKASGGAAVLAWWALSSAAPPATPPPLTDLSTQPIIIDSGPTNVDIATSTTVFENITITQGSLKLQADRARATAPGDFANTRWTFDGHVRLDAAERGSMRADQAVVDFKDNRIARATITGKPAEFEQKRAAPLPPAHGHADEIVYDVNAGTVQLSKDAWLSDGQHDIYAPVVLYNVREQHIQAAASPGSDQRVHIVIQPKPTQNPQP
jgi:lipopolysaccharide transport protein LptA